MKFAVMFGNRGFFLGELVASAIEDFKSVLKKYGHEALIMEGAGTRYDAVETPEEGRKYAEFLAAHRGEYDGVILSLPNFGDENGAVVALRDAGVPILVQAYPDEPGQMDFSHRRDSVCGKIAMCNVLRQADIKYTLTTGFAESPDSPQFAEDLRNFAAVCRVVKGMRRFNIGAIGARTTAFKTVRVDEIALQRKGVNVECVDLAEVFAMMDGSDAAAVAEKRGKYLAYADFAGVAEEKIDAIARLGVAFDTLIERFSLDAIAVRCWDELQKRYGIAPCLVMSVLNESGIAAACEMDVNNAVMMRAVALASDSPVGLFDVNNNFGDAKDKAIMFHCSAIPGSMLCGKGCIGEHLMFKKAYGPGTGIGIFGGEVKAMPLTVGSFKTEDGKLCAFVTEGDATDDRIEKDFFGTGFVFRKDDGDANSMLNYMAKNGYRHHVAFVRGNWSAAIVEAFSNYLGYEVDRI
jgi:L-fucose isomerase-like protein